MTREEIIARFCALSTKVMREHFGSTRSADCFCGDNPISDHDRLQFETEIMAFIERAVEERLKNTKPQPRW